jgi:hypothetical protein
MRLMLLYMAIISDFISIAQLFRFVDRNCAAAGKRKAHRTGDPVGFGKPAVLGSPIASGTTYRSSRK